MTGHLLPLVQSIPHPGLAVPPQVAGQLAVDGVALYNECDLWADQLFDFAHPDLAPLHGSTGYAGSLAAVSLDIARALVDANRRPEDLDDPDGPIKSHTSYGRPIYTTPLSPTQKVTLRDRYWADYHRRLAQALAEHGKSARLFLDCHNMAQIGPSAYAFAGAPRPKICLGNFGDGSGAAQAGQPPLSCPPWFIQAAAQLAQDLFADLPLLDPQPGPEVAAVAINWPFPGGYILQHYGQACPFAVMVEVNRGLFVGNQGPDTPIAPPNQAAIGAVRERLFRWAVELIKLT